MVGGVRGGTNAVDLLHNQPRVTRRPRPWECARLVFIIVTNSADGTDVHAVDEGRGPVILILHLGMDDGRSWGKVAALLARRFRVVRLHRRQYRLDIETGAPATMAQEVDDVLAVVKVTGDPVVLVGHSSGGVVALQALVASPSSFAGAVVYEPPVVIGPLLGGEALARARTALAAGRLRRAIEIFFRNIVGMSPLLSWLGATRVAVLPRWRQMVGRQLDDVGAIDQLGVRLDAYAGIEVPTVLLGGDRSPRQLVERLDALARVMPRAERVMLPRQGHIAHLTAPKKVAHLIEDHADKVMALPKR
jgi:pimeloyl-ACP methyl ester carboxylesterase